MGYCLQNADNIPFKFFIMKQQLIREDGQLNLTASHDSAPGDFDFLVGKWKIYNRKLKTRLNNCQDWTKFEATGEVRKILLGFGNRDKFVTTIDGYPFEGMTLRLFNPLTKLWSIYWADSIAVVLDTPVMGSFENNTGRFYTKDRFEGREILMQFKWDKTNPDEPVWSQAFSADNGKTWEWNWYMNFYKANENGESEI
jgi:hypothetical protein